jgi:hypothetical protein
MDEASHLISQAQIDQQPVRPSWPHHSQLNAQIRATFAHNRSGQVNKHVHFSRSRVHGRDCLSKRRCKSYIIIHRLKKGIQALKSSFSY